MKQPWGDAEPVSFEVAADTIKQSWMSRHASLDRHIRVIAHESTGEKEMEFTVWRASFAPERLVFLGLDATQVIRLSNDAVLDAWSVATLGVLHHFAFETIDGTIEVTVSDTDVNVPAECIVHCS